MYSGTNITMNEEGGGGVGNSHEEQIDMGANLTYEPEYHTNNNQRQEDQNQTCNITTTVNDRGNELPTLGAGAGSGRKLESNQDQQSDIECTGQREKRIVVK